MMNSAALGHPSFGEQGRSGSRTGRHSWWFSSLTVALALIVSAAFVGIALPAKAATPSKLGISFLGPTGSTTSTGTLQRASSQLVQVKISNNTTSPSGESNTPTLTLAATQGVVIQSVRQTQESSPGTWSCSGTTTATCSLRTISGKPFSLAGSESIVVDVVIDTKGVSSAQESAVITASASFSGLGSASATDTLNTVNSENSVSGIHLLVSGNSVVLAGSQSTIAYEVDNGGASDLTPASTGQPSVILANLLPNGSYTSWTSNSPGWKCTAVNGAGPTCSLSDSVAISQRSTPLVISYQVAPNAPSASTTRQVDTPYAWKIALAASLATKKQVHGSIDQLLDVVSSLPNSLSVALQATSSNLVMAGGSITAEVKHLTTSNLTSGIRDVLTLPSDMTMDPVSFNGWTCPGGQGSVTCLHNAVPTANQPLGSFPILLKSSTSISNGVKTLSLESSTIDGSRSGTASLPFFVLSFGNLAGNLAPSQTTTPQVVTSASTPGLVITSTSTTYGAGAAPNPANSLQLKVTGATAGTPITYTVSSSSNSSGCAVTPGTATLTYQNAGTCNVTATQGSLTSSTTLISINKATPVVTITSTATTYDPVSQTMQLVTSGGGGGATFTVSQTATNNAGCAVALNSSTLTYTSAGTPIAVGACTVTANMPASTNYLAGTSQPTQITIYKATAPTPIFTSTSTTYNPTNPTMALSLTNASPGAVVTYSVTNANVTSTPACSISGATLTYASGGQCNVQVSESQTSNYLTNTATQLITILPTGQPDLYVTSNNSQDFGSPPLQLASLGGNGTGAVTFAATSGSAGCSVNTASNKLSFTSTGTCVITATKAATASYTVQTATQTFTVNQAAQKQVYVSSLNLPAPITNQTPPTPSGLFNPDPSKTNLTLTSFGGSTNGAVTYAVDGTSPNSAGCTVVGNILHYTGAGTCSVIATMAGNSNYLASVSAPALVAISKVTGTVGVTLSSTGSPVTSTNYSSNPSTAQLYVVEAPGEVDNGSLVYSLYQSMVLGVTGGSGSGSVVYTVADSNNTADCSIAVGSSNLVFRKTNSTTPVSCSVTAHQGGSSPSEVTATITLLPATQALTVTSVLTTYLSSSPSLVLTTTGGSGAGVTYALTGSTTNSAGCSIAAGSNVLTLTSSGTCYVTATDSEGDTSQSTLITIQASGSPLAIATTQVASNNSAGCSISGSLLSYVGPGSCVVRALQGESQSYLATASAPTTITINPAPALTVVASAETSSGATSADNTATLSVQNGYRPPSAPAPTFTVSGTGCSLAGATLSFSQAGVCSVTATVAAYTATTPCPNANCTVSSQSDTLDIVTSNLGGSSGQSYTTAFNPITPSVILAAFGGTGSGAITYSVTDPGSASCVMDGQNPQLVDYMATLPTNVAPNQQFSCRIRATQSGGSSVEFTLIVQAPSASFAVATVSTVYSASNPTMTLATTGETSGWTISYVVVSTSSNTAGCSTSNGGNVLTYSSTGVCTVVATQTPPSGSTSFPAYSAPTTITVNPAPVIPLPTVGNTGGTYTPSNPTICLSSSSGPCSTPLSYAIYSGLPLTITGGAGSGAINYTVASAGTAQCTIKGSTLSYSFAGTCSVTASQSGQTATATITVLPLGSPLTISTTLTAFNTKVQQLALSIVGGADTGAPVSYTVSNSDNSAGCSIATGSNLLSYTTIGTCSVTASQSGQTATATITIAASSSALAISSLVTEKYLNTAHCSISGSVLTYTGAGVCTVVATQAATTNYLAGSSLPTLITIGQATQVPNLASQQVIYNFLAPYLSLTPSAGTPNLSTGPVLYSVDQASANTAGCTIGIGSSILNYSPTPRLTPSSSSETCSVVVTWTGDQNYVTTSATYAITVNPPPPLTITSTQTTYLAGNTLTYQLTSSGGSGPGAVTFQLSDSGTAGCSISGSILTYTTAGTCGVTATKVGNSGQASATVTIAKAQQAPITLVYSNASSLQVKLTPLGGSGSGTFSWTALVTGASSVTPIPATPACLLTSSNGIETLTFGVGNGSCSVTLTRSGDVNYQPLSITSVVATTITLIPQWSPLTITSTLTTFTSGSQTMGLSVTGGAGSGAVTYSVSQGSATPNTAGCAITSGSSTLRYLTVGTCTVTATQAGLSATATVTVQAASSPLAITSTLTTYNQNTPSVTLTTTGGVGPVTFSVVNPSSISAGCSISGSTLTYTGPGTCTLTATPTTGQSASVTFVVAPASSPLSISSGSLSTTFGTGNAQGSGTSSTKTALLATSGGNPNATGKISYQVVSSGTAGCSVSQNVLTYTGNGTCTLTATQASDATYLAGTSATATFTVNPSASTTLLITTTQVTFVPGSATPAPIQLGVDGLATGHGTLSFQVVDAGTASCSIVNGLLAYTTTGTCVVSATTLQNGSTQAQTSANTTITIAPSAQSGISLGVTSVNYGGTPGGTSTTVTLSISGGSGPGAVSYTVTSNGTAGCSISGGTLTYQGVGTCVITATQAASANYQAQTSLATTFTVLQGVQSPLSITSTSIPFTQARSASFTTNPSAPLPETSVLFSIVSAGSAGCSIVDSALMYSSVGTCTVQATNMGNGNYQQVTSPITTITITKGTQPTVTFSTTTTNPTYAPSPSNTVALVSGGGASTGTVTFSLVTSQTNTAGCSVAGSTLTYLSVGSCTIQATSPGNSNWNVASSTQVITVGKATQSPLSIVPTATTVSSPKTLQLSSSGGSGSGAVSYTLVSAGSAGCSLTGSTLNYTGAGTCTISATKATSQNYLAATSGSVQITVNGSSFAIAVTSTTFNPANPTLTLTTTGGQGSSPVVYSISGIGNTAGCTLQGQSVLSFANAGICVVTATKGTQTSSATTITINLASQSPLSFTSSSTPAFAPSPLNTLTLTASGGSNTGAIKFLVTSVGTAGCSVSGATLTFLTAGICTVSATSPGNSQYAALTVSQGISVLAPPQTGESYTTLAQQVSTSSTPSFINLGGGITISLTGFRCGSSCASSMSFNGGSLNLFGMYTITVGSGTVTPTGFTFTSATLATPAGWPGGSLSTLSIPGFKLTYTGGSLSSMVQAEGTFSLGTTADFLGIPMPSGWQMATQLSMNDYLGQTAGITITSTLYSGGSAPANCSAASANCLQLKGSASKAGTFSVTVVGSLQLAGPSVSLTGINLNWQSGSPFAGQATLAIGGTTVSVKMSYTNATTWAVTANGSFSFFGIQTVASGSVSQTTAGGITGTFTMTVTASLSGGMTATLSATWTPQNGITATGSINFNSGIGTVTATATYVTSTNYSFTISGPSNTMNLIPGVIALGGVSGSYAYGGPVNVTGTVVLFNSFSSTISLNYNNATTWVITVSPANQPNGVFQIAPGATLSTTTLTDGQSTCNGVTLAKNTLCVTSAITFSSFGTLNLVGTYTNSQNWTFTATTSSPTTFTVIPGLTISLSQFSGGLSEVNGRFGWSLTLALSGTYYLYGSSGSGASLALANPVISFSSTCPTVPGGTTLCPPGTGNTNILSFSGTVTLNLGVPGISPYSIAFAAAYGVQTGTFALSASLSNITIIPSVLVITSPKITVSYLKSGGSNTVSTGNVAFGSGEGTGNKGGYAVSVSGNVSLSLPSIGSLTIPVTFTYQGSGYVISASFTTGSGLGSTGANLSTLAYSSIPQQLTFKAPSGSGLTPINEYLNAPGIVFGGSVMLPGWLNSFLGINDLAPVSIFVTYSSATSYSVSAVFPLQIPIDTGTSDFTFSFTNFTLTMEENGTSFLQSVSVSGTMTLSGAANGGGSSTINVTMGLQYLDLPPQITGFISASGQGNPVWSNVFGIPGLDIQEFNIAIGVSLTPPIPFPDLGFQAEATLTGSFWTELGLNSGDIINVALNISDANPCMGISISNATPGANVVSIAGGALTATYAEMYLAPNGCQIGTFSLPPGFTFAFDGALFGVQVDVQAAISITPTLGFAASLTIGTFNLADIVTLQEVNVQIAMNHALLNPNATCPANSSTFILCFSGGIDILGETATLAGEVTLDSFSLTGTLSGFSGLGSEFSMGPLSIQTSGTITGTPSFALNASGSLSVLGSSVAITIGFSFANYQIVSMTFYASINSCLWKLNLAIIAFQACFGGVFNFNLSSSSGTFFFSADLSASIQVAYYSPDCGNPFKSCFWHWSWSGWDTVFAINVYVDTNGNASASFNICGYSESFSLDIGDIFG